MFKSSGTRRRNDSGLDGGRSAMVAGYRGLSEECMWEIVRTISPPPFLIKLCKTFRLKKVLYHIVRTQHRAVLVKAARDSCGPFSYLNDRPVEADAQQLLPRQPCDWRGNPVVNGLTLAALDPGAHEDPSYPLKCPAATYGNSFEAAAQSPSRRPRKTKPGPSPSQDIE